MADQQGVEKLLITSSGPDSGLNETQKPDQSGSADLTSLKPALPRDSLSKLRRDGQSQCELLETVHKPTAAS